MLEIIITWMYMLFVCGVTGFGIWKFISKFVPIPKATPISSLTTGIVSISIYVQLFSVVYKIALVAQVVVIAYDLLILFIYRKELFEEYRNVFHKYLSWRGAFYLAVVLFFAFFTSRGVFHTDTNIYHAANIRIYEEVGLIKGMANLQWNFGYNSAYLGFASFFSFGWLLSAPVHATTGFLEIVYGGYAVLYLSGFKRHKYHVADACAAGTWIYILVIITYSMSPATDYAAMLMALYAITRWFVLAEKIRLLKNDGSEHDELIKHESVYEYALLCVLMVFILTVKISAGVMVLVVLYPLVLLIRRKDIKSIGVFLLLGIITLFPYLLRNYYISGWLIYPFEGIDIFNPDWKVPLETLQRDAALIKTYGRGLCDAELIDTHLRSGSLSGRTAFRHMREIS